MSALHQAVARAIADALGVRTGPLGEHVYPEEWAEQAAAAAVGVVQADERPRCLALAAAARRDERARVLAEAQRAVEALPATGRGAWLLCRTTGEVATNTKSPAAPRCPAHDGAECLALYVQQAEALAVLAALAEAQA